MSARYVSGPKGARVINRNFYVLSFHMRNETVKGIEARCSMGPVVKCMARRSLGQGRLLGTMSTTKRLGWACLFRCWTEPEHFHVQTGHIWVHQDSARFCLGQYTNLHHLVPFAVANLSHSPMSASHTRTQDEKRTSLSKLITMGASHDLH